MTQHTRTTSALIRSAITAAQESGFAIGAVEVRKGGFVRILARDAVTALPSPEKGENTCDGLFGEESGCEG